MAQNWHLVWEAETRGWYHGGQRPSSLYSPTVIPPSALNKPSIMKRYHRQRTTRWSLTARSPTVVTLYDTLFVECQWWNDGWTVKTVVAWRLLASMILAPGCSWNLLASLVRYPRHILEAASNTQTCCHFKHTNPLLLQSYIHVATLNTHLLQLQTHIPVAASNSNTQTSCCISHAPITTMNTQIYCSFKNTNLLLLQTHCCSF